MDSVRLIYRVLSGDASDEEKAQLDNWIRQSDENGEEYLNIKLLLENRSVEDDSNVGFTEGLSGIKRKAAKRKYHAVVVMAIKYLVIFAVLFFLLSLIYRARVSKGKNSDVGNLSWHSEFSPCVFDRVKEYI
ncbi:MAG TPA: hypothetical protein VIN08_01290 [Ohtaekwangia sp.]|uniref:hypothetical protein n=1 Tax=Ohtaekwangia sp. TaxID=2066019 RepID=UPI002F91C103